MNQFPIFLDFECSSPDEDGFPIAVSWSLPDGQVKSTLISPEDHWLDYESSHFDDHHLDIDDLMLHGVSALEVIRELQADIDADVVYVDGLGEDEHWLDKLYQAYQMEPQFALEPAYSLYETDSEAWIDQKQTWLEENGLDPYQSEANVVAMLHLHQAMAFDGENDER